jgi:hypothetical protein
LERTEVSKISLKLSKKTKREVLTLARNVRTGLTDNAFVPIANPSLPTLQTAIDNAQAAFDDYEAEKQALHAKKLARDGAFAALENLLRAEAVTVQTVTGGSALQIVTTGFAVADAPTATRQPPAQVLNLRVSATDFEGSLKASWKRVPDAQRYDIDASIDPPTLTSWVRKDSSSKRKALVNGFISGQRMWLRVRAVNSNGPGTWSDAAGKIVP